jgi:predicted kinase
VAEVVIINGPPGVGKTTVSRVLASLVPGTVCIRGDDLRAFSPIDAREHLGGGSTFRAAAVLAKAYLAMGASRVLIDYVFLRRSHVAYFRESFGSETAPAYMFTLWAPLRVVQAREQARVARSPLGSAVEECWNEIDLNRSMLGEFIENTALTPTEVASRISAFVSGREQRRPI